MNRFDRFCARVSAWVAHAGFFAGCAFLVLAWLAEGMVKVASSGWGAFAASGYQLQINTTTTIVTFLLVALLQNSSRQSENATNAKLDTVLKGLADLDATNTDLLERMVGAEEQIGSDKPPKD